MCVGNVALSEPLILDFSRSPKVSVICATFGGLRIADEDAYGDALLNVENVLIFRAIGRQLLFLTAAVEIKEVEIREGLKEFTTHPAESRIVEVAVVRDEGKNPCSRPLNAPLA